MTLNLKEPCVFKVGETYQTKGCGPAFILEYGPNHDLYGRVKIKHDSSWFAMCWRKDGFPQQALSLATHDDLHLMAPKRQVWIGIWLDDADHVQVDAFTSEAEAEEEIRERAPHRIAVAGPFVVEPTT